MTSKEKDEILERIKTMYEEEKIECKIEAEDNPELGIVKTLYTYHTFLGPEENESAFGELAFVPLDGEEEGSMQIFVINFVFDAEIPEDKVERLTDVLCEVNYVMPGCFLLLTPGKDRLALRVSAFIPDEFNVERAYNVIDCALGNVEMVMENIISQFCKYIKGEAEDIYFNME